MLRHESRNEVVHFPLPACDSHADIVGEYKAKSSVGANSVVSARVPTTFTTDP